MDTILTTPSRHELGIGDSIVRVCFDPAKGLFLCMVEQADMTYALRAFDPLAREWRNAVVLPNIDVARHVYMHSTSSAHNVHVACM